MRAWVGWLVLVVAFVPDAAARQRDDICWIDEHGNRRCDALPVNGSDWIWDRVNSALPAGSGGSSAKLPGSGGGGGAAPAGSGASQRDASPCGELVGNPILPATGNKLEIEPEFTTSGEMP